MSKPAIPENIIDQAPKARIVQYRKKRYSMRLEPVFWHALERMAQDRGVKLGRFLVELEEHHQGVNFASFLRSYCMIEAEGKFASHNTNTTRANLGDILINSPAAGCVLNRNMLLVNANDAFYNWIGENKKRLEGSNINSLLRIRVNRDMKSAWDELVKGESNFLDASIVRVTTGRVVTAKSRFIGLQVRQNRHPVILMWLNTAPKTAGVAARPVTSLSPATERQGQKTPQG